MASLDFKQLAEWIERVCLRARHCQLALRIDHRQIRKAQCAFWSLRMHSRKHKGSISQRESAQQPQQLPSHAKLYKATIPALSCQRGTDWRMVIVDKLPFDNLYHGQQPLCSRMSPCVAVSPALPCASCYRLGCMW